LHQFDGSDVMMRRLNEDAVVCRLRCTDNGVRVGCWWTIIYFGFCFGGKNETKRKNSSSNKTKQNESKHQRYHLVCDNEINQIIFSKEGTTTRVNAINLFIFLLIAY
jgi:hypothetical protein